MSKATFYHCHKPSLSYPALQCCQSQIQGDGKSNCILYILKKIYPAKTPQLITYMLSTIAYNTLLCSCKSLIKDSKVKLKSKHLIYTDTMIDMIHWLPHLEFQSLGHPATQRATLWVCRLFFFFLPPHFRVAICCEENNRLC